MLNKIRVMGMSLFAVSLIAPAFGIAQSTSKRDCIQYSERLERYFEGSQHRARHIVNNDLDPGPLKSGIESIEIGGVAVEWIVTLKDKHAVDVTIRIDGHRIELKDQKPINLADDDKPIGPDLLSIWDQIRLYEFGDGRKMVAMTLRPGMCTGLMCGVAAQLYFDLRSKRASFFGSYRTDGEAKLYSFGQDGREAFVVATNFSGDPHGSSESVVMYELYRLHSDGRFVREGDTAGRKYFIKHVQQPERSSKGDSVEDRWIERIRLDR
ncbi:MAG: hypothetical protein IPM25_03730 [Chloracidobacterium sp.]|nr:hypothetical protein [Chloracidobacterium sp.]